MAARPPQLGEAVPVASVVQAAAAEGPFAYDVIQWDLTDPSSRAPDPTRIGQYLRFRGSLKPGGDADERWTTGGGAPRMSTAGYNYATAETRPAEELKLTSDEKTYGIRAMRIEPTVFMAVSAKVSGNDPGTFGPDDVYGFVVMSRLRDAGGTVRLLVPMGLTKTPVGYGYFKPLLEYYKEGDLRNDKSSVFPHRTRAKRGIAAALFSLAHEAYPHASIMSRLVQAAEKALQSLIKTFPGQMSVGFKTFITMTQAHYAWKRAMANSVARGGQPALATLYLLGFQDVLFDEDAGVVRWGKSTRDDDRPIRRLYWYVGTPAAVDVHTEGATERFNIVALPAGEDLTVREKHFRLDECARLYDFLERDDAPVALHVHDMIVDDGAWVPVEGETVLRDKEINWHFREDGWFDRRAFLVPNNAAEELPPQTRRTYSALGAAPAAVEVDAIEHTCLVHGFKIEHTDAIPPLHRIISKPDVSTGVGTFFAIAPLRPAPG